MTERSKAPIAIIGAGPAGLIAAEVLSAAGRTVHIYDRMPSPARKFLMAGRGGLNLTHSEPFDAFLGRYGTEAAWLKPMLEAFTPADLRAWADGLGAETFTGTSGRVFPKALKASPLLRQWLNRLSAQGVVMHTRHDWSGFGEDGSLRFATPEGEIKVISQQTLLALGGASWPRLGADGGWAHSLKSRSVTVTDFVPANMGVRLNWSAYFADAFAGTPLKNVAVAHMGQRVRGEVMITRTGLEGGAIYALSRHLRDTLGNEALAELHIDLKPELTQDAIEKKLQGTDSKQSLSTRLRKSLNLPPVAVSLLREAESKDDLPNRIKALALKVTGTHGLDRAISSGGGISRAAVGPDLQLNALPGVYVAGEMLDWEAPTGGYLLQACFATGVWAARAMMARLP